MTSVQLFYIWFWVFFLANRALESVIHSKHSRATTAHLFCSIPGDREEGVPPAIRHILRYEDPQHRGRRSDPFSIDALARPSFPLLSFRLTARIKFFSDLTLTVRIKANKKVLTTAKHQTFISCFDICRKYYGCMDWFFAGGESRGGPRSGSPHVSTHNDNPKVAGPDRNQESTEYQMPKILITHQIIRGEWVMWAGLRKLMCLRWCGQVIHQRVWPGQPAAGRGTGAPAGLRAAEALSPPRHLLRGLLPVRE